MVNINTPCPQCGHQPVCRYDLADGHIWACRACGHQEMTAGVDIEAQLRELAKYDPDLAGDWCETLGIPVPS